MGKIRTILTFLLVALLLGAWTMPPAGLVTSIDAAQANSVSLTTVETGPAAVTVNLTFTNKTGAVISLVTLKGPRTYNFYNVQIGKTTWTVEKGKYTITYKACGKNRSKTVSVSGNVKFTTDACKTVKIKVNNKTGGTLFIYMSGPTNYNFSLAPGNHVITVWPGSYKYTGSGRCGSLSGNKKFTGGFTWTWWCS